MPKVPGAHLLVDIWSENHPNSLTSSLPRTPGGWLNDLQKGPLSGPAKPRSSWQFQPNLITSLALERDHKWTKTQRRQGRRLGQEIQKSMEMALTVSCG